MNWADLTSPALDAIDRHTPVIMNIGAIEQHGPHLPLDTDALIGRRLLELLDARNPDGVLILPQVAIGCSAHHMDFAGSLTVRHETLSAYVCDVFRAVLAHGFHNIVLFNSHGGNLGVGQVIFERLGAENRDANVFFFTWWKIVGDALRNVQESPFGGVGHACEFETSLIAFFQGVEPDRVSRTTRRDVSTFPWARGDMLNGADGAYYRSLYDISGGDGIDGDPQFASRDKGERIATLVASQLDMMMRDISRVSRDAVMPNSGQPPAETDDAERR